MLFYFSSKFAQTKILSVTLVFNQYLIYSRCSLLMQGFFGVFSEAKIWPHSQWNLGDFIILKKNPNLQKKGACYY